MYIVILLYKLDAPYIFMKNRGEDCQKISPQNLQKEKKSNLSNNVSKNLKIFKSQNQKKKKKGMKRKEKEKSQEKSSIEEDLQLEIGGN